jgi:hypothetical protein
MAHIYFEETQQLSSLRWLWAVATLPIIIPLYLITKVSSSQEEFLKVMGVILLAWTPLIIIIMRLKLYLRADEKGFHYKFFIKTFGWKTLSPQAIVSVEIKEPRTWLEKLTIGYTRNILNNTVIMNITGNKLVHIKTAGGPLFKIGSENADGLANALQKLLAKTRQQLPD